MYVYLSSTQRPVHLQPGNEDGIPHVGTGSNKCRCLHWEQIGVCCSECGPGCMPKQLTAVASLLPEQGTLAGLTSYQCRYGSLAKMEAQRFFGFCFYFPLVHSLHFRNMLYCYRAVLTVRVGFGCPCFRCHKHVCDKPGVFRTLAMCCVFLSSP